MRRLSAKALAHCGASGDDARMRARWLVFCFGLVGAGTARLPAALAAPGERRVGAAAGVAAASRLGAGPAFRLSLVTEPLSNLEVGVSAGLFGAASAAETGTARPWPLSLTPSVSYQFDVVRWIPYAGFGFGYWLDLNDTSRHDAVLAPELGIDYLLTREVRLGVQYRPALYFDLGPLLPVHQALFRVQLGSGW
jgi:hypothetical protein